MRSKSFLYKLVLFGCIVSILPVIFIGVFSYVQSSKQVQKQVNQGELQIVKQVNSSVEQILMTVNHTLTSLAESKLMEEALNSPMQAKDFMLYNDLRSESSYLQAFETKVEDVVIISKKNDWIIKNRGLSRLSEHDDRRLYEAYFNLENSSEWVLLHDVLFTEAISSRYDCDYTLSLVKKLPIKSSMKYGLAFANISPCSILDLIEYEQGAGEFMIIDQNHKILVHHDLSMIGTYLSDAFRLNDEQAFTGFSGQFRTTYKNSPYTVTYVNSTLNQWTYLSLVSISELNKESRQIGWFTLIVSLLIISISVLFVWLTTKKLYSPVNKLVKYIEESGEDLTQETARKDEVQFIEEQVKKFLRRKRNFKTK